MTVPRRNRPVGAVLARPASRSIVAPAVIGYHIALWRSLASSARFEVTPTSEADLSLDAVLRRSAKQPYLGRCR